MCSEVYLGSYLNIETGELAWKYLDEKEDVLQSVMGMSQMSSMLKDKRRNEAYNSAISECIRDFIQQHGRKPYVLDIGCGTGLLSLQAARAGAEKVFGCEMFRSWAEIAAKNVIENGFENVITIFNKHSSALTVEELGQRCDILVSEILDTVLLGEGVLKAVRDAKKRLLVPNALIIPEKADVYVELVRSPLYALTTVQDALNRREKLVPDAAPRCRASQLFPVSPFRACSLDPRRPLRDRVVLCAHSPHHGGSDRRLQSAPAHLRDSRSLGPQRPSLRLGSLPLPRPPALLHARRRAQRLGGPLAAGLLPALRPRGRRADGVPRRSAARHQLEVRRLRAGDRQITRSRSHSQISRASSRE
ncbi:uncharacterized protein [Blastocystis hominis]|uniref:Methyltransferase domain-containing protein n=1 Tax=Blastocystis hominis TaxID=12968 RepID=D8LWA2_BLAHO|nr:uncharacterized protein [Blastocystis hominis]CBK20091.2 unnamed protein product [Blastocystis hominis]|eukprot:XP_012894139.1 uncharacterized protein [Blastocystis hominis]